MEIQIVLLLVEFALHGLGVFAANSRDILVNPNVALCVAKEEEIRIFVNVIVEWGIIISILSFLGIIVLFYGSLETGPSTLPKRLRIWAERIKWMLGTQQKQNETLEDVVKLTSREFAEYFTDDMDWSVSDLMVGLILLRQRQKDYKKRHPHLLKPKEEVSKQTIDEIKLFLRYAELMYYNEDINHLGQDHLVFTDFSNSGNFEVPYLLAYSIRTKSVVIAIRGVYSNSDLLVSLKLDLEELEDADGRVNLVHSGMLLSARKILKDIKKHGALYQILQNSKADRIVVCGHSMGAGVAALLTFLLRQDPLTKEATCISYCPPGSLITEKSVPIFDAFCTTVIIGDDFVPRLTRNAMDLLKADLMDALLSCQMPKWKILGSLFCFGQDRIVGSSSLSDIESSVAQSQSGKQDLTSVDQQSHHGIDKNSKAKKEIKFCMPRMHPPGRILYFEKLPVNNRPSSLESQQETTGARRLYTYVPRWAPREEFERIAVSGSMLKDHSPFALLRDSQ